MKCLHHQHHTHEKDQKFLTKMAFLDSRQREQLIIPETLIGQMPILKDHVLLDVGAGTGFFTIPMAEATNGRVYAMDPDQRMLGVIADKAEAKALTNIEPLKETIEGLSLPNNHIDFAMASLILHEVSSLEVALTKIFEVLKSGGHLLCLEYQKDDSITEGPPMAIRIHLEDLQKTLSLVGFEIVKTTKINEAIYTVLAVKRQK